ncbi:MAG: ATP-binding cassette domain-containing protein, partial [Bdellovibrionota bacterium]
RSETLESVFGVFALHGPKTRGYSFKGDIWIHGIKRSIADPAAALNAKLAFVSEDRKGNGLVLMHSIRSNMSLPSLVAGRGDIAGTRAFSSVSEFREREKVSHWTRELKIRSANMDQTVGQLSGGNQQKVVLSKWLMTDPDILFLDEPTRGIDIGAKVEIYQWIRKLAEKGIAIVIASSEMPEILGLCHRVLVFREGKVSAELGAEATQEKIMRAAAL